MKQSINVYDHDEIRISKGGEGEETCYNGQSCAICLFLTIFTEENSIVKIHKCTSSHFQTNFKLIPRKQLENNIKKQHNTNQNNFGLNLLTLRGRVVI